MMPNFRIVVVFKDGSELSSDNMLHHIVFEDKDELIKICDKYKKDVVIMELENAIKDSMHYESLKDFKNCDMIYIAVDFSQACIDASEIRYILLPNITKMAEYIYNDIISNQEKTNG